MTIALILIAIWTSVVIWAWVVKGRPEAPTMITALLAGGGLPFCTFLWTIMTENKHKKEKENDQS